MQVGMTQDVAGAVKTWCLAVPHPNDSVMLSQWSKMILLTSPHSSGREILIETVNVGYRKSCLVHAAQRLIKTGQWRTWITRHERRGSQATGMVCSQLICNDSSRCLQPSQQNVVIAQRVALGE